VTLGKDAISITLRRNGCFSLPSAREKVLGKEGFADALFVEPSLPSATLGKAKALVSGSEDHRKNMFARCLMNSKDVKQYSRANPRRVFEST
jgi:hypothetical protein